MKVLIINRMKLGVMLIVTGLVLVVIFMGYSFESKIKYAAFLENDIKSLKTYSIKGESVVYKLPAEWSYTEEKLYSDEILYHGKFTSKNNDIHGYVELWKLGTDLKDFLNNSKEISEQQNDISSYNIKDFSVSNIKGYNISYYMNIKNSGSYYADEYFLKYKDKFIRFAFYVQKDKYKESMKKNFDTIVGMLQFN